MAQRIKNLQVKPEDVWIASYPKSGTTWTQEMMWLICNDLDYAGARAVTLDERFPFLEYFFMHFISELFIENNTIFLQDWQYYWQ